jgi:hypothetical protein
MTDEDLQAALDRAFEEVLRRHIQSGVEGHPVHTVKFPTGRIHMDCVQCERSRIGLAMFTVKEDA